MCHCFCADVPPKVTSQPKRLSEVVQGTAASFSVQATGTNPLSYEWQWKPAEEKTRSKEWHPCNTRWSNGATLTIPSVEMCNEGWYHCVVSNCAGRVISKPVQLSVGKKIEFSYTDIYPKWKVESGKKKLMLRKATKVHVYVQSFFPSLRGPPEV